MHGAAIHTEKSMKRKSRAVLRAAVLVPAIGIGLLWAAHLPSELDLDEAQAKTSLLAALSSGYAPVGMARNALKTMAPEKRAEVVVAVLAWAKDYIASPEFSTAWAKMREEAKPSAPAAKPTVDEELRAQRAEQEKQIEEMKTMAAGLPPEQRQAVEEGVKAMIASQAQMQNDPQMQQLLRQGIEMQRAEEQSRYEASLATWQQDYPAEPKTLIAGRLRDFLEVSATVDFDATLVPSGAKMRFEKEEYELKSADWKLCYRAGRESVGAARSFATGWLAELQ
jgi:hypothetical protein